MSLKDCMEYAVENAAQVQVQRTKVGDARLDRRDAILTAFTPSIEASTYGYYRWGRSIDPETNTYVTTTSLNNGWSVSAGITLFDGFSALNNIKIAKTSLSMGLTRERQEEDKVCLATMEAYFNGSTTLNSWTYLPSRSRTRSPLSHLLHVRKNSE